MTFSSTGVVVRLLSFNCVQTLVLGVVIDVLVSCVVVVGHRLRQFVDVHWRLPRWPLHRVCRRWRRSSRTLSISKCRCRHRSFSVMTSVRTRSVANVRVGWRCRWMTTIAGRDGRLVDVRCRHSRLWLRQSCNTMHTIADNAPTTIAYFCGIRLISNRIHRRLDNNPAAETALRRNEWSGV